MLVSRMQLRGSRSYIALASSIILAILGVSLVAGACTATTSAWRIIGVIIILLGVAMVMMTLYVMRNKRASRSHGNGDLNRLSEPNGKIERYPSVHSDIHGGAVAMSRSSVSNIADVSVQVINGRSYSTDGVNILVTPGESRYTRHISTSSVPGDLSVCVKIYQPEDEVFAPSLTCEDCDGTDKSRLLSKSLPNVSGVVQSTFHHICKDIMLSENDSQEQLKLNKIFRERSIKHLTKEHIEHISTQMDCHPNEWKSFGHKVAEVYKEKKEKYKSFILRVNHCEITYFGGGSPSKELFKYIQTNKPELSVAHFMKTAEDCLRKDIVDYIRKHNLQKDPDTTGDVSFSDIAHEHHNILACLLDKRVRQNWKLFAVRLRFTEDDINHMEVASKISPECSPTKKLFHLFTTELPTLTLDVIYNALKYINRNDLALYLESEFKTY